jgi:hypothetical protein
VIAESVLTKHQLLILNRSRRRAPNLRILDRLIAGFCSLWIRPRRLRRVAIAFKPSTFLSFHRALVQRKYRLLFSSKQRTKPGPKGPTADLIHAVVEMKERNPTWGCPQIAEQINLAFGTSMNKDAVRRILAIHYRPTSTEGGASWLTFIGHMKDSLWSLDMFRCESIVLQTYWVLVVMDQYTRRIIGFGIQPGVVDGRYGNQDGSIHSLVPSVRRATDRNNPQRMFGPVVVLDGSGFRDETDHFQRLLQQVPLLCGAEGRNADRDSGIERRRAETLWLAETMPRLIPNTNCCMTTNSP